MPSPLLFVPQQDVDEITLRGIGAGDYLDPIVNMLLAAVSNGPNGEAGTLVIFDNANDIDLKTNERAIKTSQEWRPVAPFGDLLPGRFWIGRSPNEQLSPMSLRRATPFDGIDVKLRDGNFWTIPVVEWLPMVQGIDMLTGMECRRLTKEHLEFHKQAQIYFEMFMDLTMDETEAVQRTIQFDGGFDYACMALSKNYRITRDYVDWLDLLGDNEVFHIVSATLGLDIIKQIALQKKKYRNRSFNRYYLNAQLFRKGLLPKDYRPNFIDIFYLLEAEQWPKPM